MGFINWTSMKREKNRVSLITPYILSCFINFLVYYICAEASQTLGPL